MIRCKTVRFWTKPTMWNRLFACNRESALVWNHCLERSRSYHQEHRQWISAGQLKHELKGQFTLHSQCVQSVIESYDEARTAAWKARQQGYTMKYPYKKKKHYPTCWKQKSFRVYPNGKIELSMGRGRESIVVYVQIDEVPMGTVKEVELIYDQGLRLSLCYDNGQTMPKMLVSGPQAGVDLGEIHTIAAYATTESTLIITGKKLRSIHRLRNKKVAELQRLLSRCKKGSRQWKKYQRVKRFVLSQSSRQLQDAVHKTTKLFVDWCLQQQVTEVVCGNPEGVQRRTREKKKANRCVRQKLSNWMFGKVKSYLAYKLEAKGIGLTFTDESYSSQTCPCCGNRKRTSSRLYQCACGYHQHRDIHGAQNILSKHKIGRFVILGQGKYHTYLHVA